MAVIQDNQLHVIVSVHYISCWVLHLVIQWQKHMLVYNLFILVYKCMYTFVDMWVGRCIMYVWYCLDSVYVWYTFDGIPKYRYKIHHPAHISTNAYMLINTLNMQVYAHVHVYSHAHSNKTHMHTHTFKCSFTNLNTDMLTCYRGTYACT